MTAGRGRHAGWVGLTLVAAFAAVSWTAGCASTRAVPGTAPVAAGAPLVAHSAMPSAAQLKAALLAPSDMGSAFTLQPAEPPTDGSGGSAGAGGSGSSGGTGASGGGKTTVSGCPQLQILLSVGSSPSATDQGVTYQAGQTGPTVGESLLTASPAALAAAYADDKAALESCRHLEITSDGTGFALTLTPITFGGPQSAAVRMDGTLQGLQINAYLAIDDVGPAELAYFYLQVGSGSSQVASHYYRVADAKARQL